ncbi:MAG: LruC domain-containing protein [Bacteroidetes bacterium]|nr:LruC domain-containing protein [Bacteroidota bacterium]
MKTKILFTAGIAFLLSISACKKEVAQKQDPAVLPTSIFDLKVSDDFNFKSTRDIGMRVMVQQGNYPGEIYRINVYDDFPTIAHLITSGIVEVGNELPLQFRIPSALQYLYIEKVASTGARELQRISSANYISANFNNQPPLLTMKGQPGSGLNCNTGCSTSYNNHNGNLSLSGSGVVCLTGSFSGNLTLNGSVTVRICGNASIGNINLNGGSNNSSTIYFLENSIVTVNNANLNTSNASILNYSDSLHFSSGFSVGGSFTNNGKMSVDGDLDINNGAPNFINNGSIYVSHNLNNNEMLTNNNYIFVNGKLKPNGTSTTYNYCQIYSVDNFEMNGTFNNYGYVKCYDESKINGSKTFYNYADALLSTHDITINGTINGPSSSGLGTVKVADVTTINGSGVLSGNVELCDSSGVNTNNGTISTPAAISCSNYIATSACNPEGFGSPTIIDSDGDGVADNLDDYPNDSTRAYNSYYPNATGFATIGYEDLWPSQGDYDFNDLILGYRVKKVSNAANNVVEMYTTYIVRAIGATYDNGFGFQFDDLNPSDVNTVSGQSLTKSLISLNGNKTESGQTKAVIIVYDSPEPLINRVGGSMFNTIKTNGTGTSDTTTLYVQFTSPVAASKVTQAKINPFIFVNGTRGTEVHLPNMVPTDKANTQLLGTKDDSSNPSQGRYYKTSNNLPFVIEIPANFDYPAEKESISDAYNYFISWAVSGGSNYTNWYDNLSGYRTASKIY